MERPDILSWKLSDAFPRKDIKRTKDEFTENMRWMLTQDFEGEGEEELIAAVRLMRWEHLKLNIVNMRTLGCDQPESVALPLVRLRMAVKRKFEYPQRCFPIEENIRLSDTAISINTISSRYRLILAGLFMQ